MSRESRPVDLEEKGICQVSKQSWVQIRHEHSGAIHLWAEPAEVFNLTGLASMSSTEDETADKIYIHSFIYSLIDQPNYGEAQM